jgi:serine/threonine protein kinase
VQLPPQEVGILKGLNYDRNIVQFYGACIQEGSNPMLVTEFMEGACVPVVHAITPA